MGTGYKYGSNNTDISNLIPTFPEAPDTETVFMGTNGNDGIKYLAKNNSDPWLSTVDFTKYINSYYKLPAGTYDMVDPGTKPTFLHKWAEVTGKPTKPNADNTGWIEDEWRSAILRHDGTALHLQIYHGNFGDSDGPVQSFYCDHGTIPTKVIVVMQAAGGQGCPGDFDRLGAGGGGGAWGVYIIDVPQGDGSLGQPHIGFKIPPGRTYRTGLGSGTAGGDVTMILEDGTNIVQHGGGGANWTGEDVPGSYSRATGGSGGQHAVLSGSETKIWELKSANGCAGGNGTKSGDTSKDSSDLTSGGTCPARSAYATNVSENQSLSGNKFSLGGQSGGSKQWGGGGGASQMGPGGDGAYGSSSAHGNMPSGYGGGGGGGYCANWGGASAPGYIAIYF